MNMDDLAWWLSPGVLAVLGLCVGSFLNVVIHRLPLMLDRQWRRDSAELLGQDLPDYVKLAESMGAIGFRVEHPEEVEPVVEKAQSIKDRTVVIDFRCDPVEKCYPMVPAAASNDDIIMDPR